jgi:hypothetical protein
MALIPFLALGAPIILAFIVNRFRQYNVPATGQST